MEKVKPIVTVVGSSNIDLVVKSERLPKTGETILGGDFIMVPGGKGANQAVAAAKLGAEVYFIARLGKDLFAQQSLANFKKEGVNTKYVMETESVSSGVALINVDDDGNNIIIVAPGANSSLSSDDVKKAESDISSSGALVAQLEVPLETIEFVAKLAKKVGVPFILNPAPARKLNARLLESIDVITPNEVEAQMLTAIEVTNWKSAEQAAKVLLSLGVKTVILTMGSLGFLLADNQKTEFVSAIKVKTVDTTAAGDAFTGSLAVGLALGQSVLEAALFANSVAALSVTRMGAQPSMPTRQQVENFIKENS